MRYLRIFAVVTLAALFASCASDPQAKAQRYVENGNKFFEREKFKEASIMYRRALVPVPKYGEAWYRLGLAYVKLSSLSDAYRAFINAIELQPDNTDAVIKAADIELLAGAQGGKQVKLLDDAAARGEKLLTMKGGSFDGNRILGQIAMLKKNPSEAVSHLSQAVALKPDQPGLLLAYFQALVLNQQFAEGEKVAKDLIAKHKDYAPVYDLLYIQYASRKQLPEAEAVIQEKVANNPDNGQYQLELANHYALTQQRARMDDALKQLGDPARFTNGRLLAGDYYFTRLHDFDNAQKQYEAGIQAFPKEKALYQKRMVELFANINRNDDANKLLATVLKDNPGDTDAQAMRATLRLTTGSRDEINTAATELQGLVATTPGNHLLHYNLARALAAKNDLEGARVQLEAAIKISPGFIAARELQARIYLSRNLPGKALEEADQIIQLDPKNLAGHLARSNALLMLNDREKAHDELNFLGQAYPQNQEAQFQTGFLAFEEQNYKKAGEVFGDLHRSNPKDIRSLRGMVETLAGQNKMPEAVKMMEDASAAEPDRRDLRSGVADIYVRSQRYDEAVKIYQSLLATNPKDADVLFKLGETYRRKGDLNQAIDSFRKSSQANPNDTLALMQLGLLMDATGRREQTKPIYEQMLSIDKSHPVALNNLAYIKAEEGTDLDTALAMARQASQEKPQSLEISDTLGLVYYKKNLNQEAIRIFTDLVKSEPTNPLYRMHYGMALVQKGDKPAAKRELEAALSNKPSRDEAVRIQEILRTL